MNKQQSVISALLGAGITALAFTIVTPTETITKKPVVYSELLAKATPECQALVGDAENCQLMAISNGSKCTPGPLKDEPIEGGGTTKVATIGTCEKVTGYVCSNGYQPRAIQDCLGEAANKLAEAKSAEEAITPK